MFTNITSSHWQAELRALAEMKAQGVLTDDEFAAAKAKLLASP